MQAGRKGFLPRGLARRTAGFAGQILPPLPRISFCPLPVRRYLLPPVSGLFSFRAVSSRGRASRVALRCSHRLIISKRVRDRFPCNAFRTGPWPIPLRVPADGRGCGQPLDRRAAVLCPTENFAHCILAKSRACRSPGWNPCCAGAGAQVRSLKGARQPCRAFACACLALCCGGEVLLRRRVAQQRQKAKQTASGASEQAHLNSKSHNFVTVS